MTLKIITHRNTMIVEKKVNEFYKEIEKEHGENGFIFTHEYRVSGGNIYVFIEYGAYEALK